MHFLVLMWDYSKVFSVFFLCFRSENQLKEGGGRVGKTWNSNKEIHGIFACQNLFNKQFSEKNNVCPGSGKHVWG